MPLRPVGATGGSGEQKKRSGSGLLHSGRPEDRTASLEGIQKNGAPLGRRDAPLPTKETTLV